MFVNDLFEKKKSEPEKPRNFVAKNAKMGGAGAHKDKKKADKQGDVKHKKDPAADLAESNRGYDPGFASPSAPALGDKAGFKRQELQHELGHEQNNIAIAINGRTWKVVPGRGSADSKEEWSYLNNMKSWADKKSASSGKKWTVHLTGAPVTNEAKMATQDKENRFKAIKQRDQKQDQITHQAMNNVNDEVAEGVATTMPMSDAVKVLKHYGAEHFKTTSNELHFYKNGRGLSVDLVWNDDATRSVTLSSLNSATRKLKGQGVAEGKKPDNYHIVNKDGKPASLASYADRASAEKDRDANHPGAEVRQVGPRGKVKGVSEGLPQTLRKVVPGYAKREIDQKMDAEKFGRTDVDRDANFHRYKKIQDKIKNKGVAEGIDTEELANEVYAEFERIYPNLARRADERTVHAAIMDVLNYGGDSDPGALAQDVARAVKQEMQQGMSEGSELKQAKRKYNQAAKDANADQVGAGKKIDTMKKSLRQKDINKQVAEANLGHVLPWPAFVNKISSAMKAMGWKGQQRKDTGAFMFSTKGQLDNEFYTVIIENEGNGMFTYALGTVEEGDPHIGEKDTLPITEASVSELMTAIREGFGLGETVSEDQNAYGYEVGQTVKLHNGAQGRVLDIFDDSIEVLLPGGRTVTVDFTDAQVLDEGWKDEADDFTEWSNHVKEKLSKASPEQRLGLARQLSQLEVKHFGSTIPDTFNRQTGKPQAGLGLTDTVRNALRYFNDEQTGIRRYNDQDLPPGTFGDKFGSVTIDGMENATPAELALMAKAVRAGPDYAKAAGRIYRETGTITQQDLDDIRQGFEDNAKRFAASIGAQYVDETKSLHKRVKIVQGPDSGKYGYIRQIEHGQYKGAPKKYDVDIEGGGQANGLPATALRMAKDQQGVAEVAPPGAKAERMVKHIKKGYAKDGKLSPKEKSIAYATAWKAHNKEINEEMEIRIIEMRMNGYEL